MARAGPEVTVPDPTGTTVELDGETGRLLPAVVISPAGHLRWAGVLVCPWPGAPVTVLG